jgi:hypothetical protein
MQPLHGKARHPADLALAGLRRLVLGRFTARLGILPTSPWPASAGWC